MNTETTSIPFTKLALIAALASVTKTVEIEGVGGISIHQISVVEADAIRAASKEKDGQEFGLRLVIASLVDIAGAPLFEEADLPMLQASADAKVGRIVEAVLEVNGFKKAAVPNAQS
jgi:hypothetical protein